MKFYSSKNKGFTLIELLVVISIIALLSSVVLSSLSTARAKSRDARRMQDLVQLRTALELYAAANDGHYPISKDGSGLPLIAYVASTPSCTTYGYGASGVNNAFDQLVAGKFISKVPSDPKPVPASGFCYMYYGIPDDDSSLTAVGVGYKLRIFGTIETFDPIATKHPLHDMRGDTTPPCSQPNPSATNPLRRTLVIATPGAECE